MLQPSVPVGWLHARPRDVTKLRAQPQRQQLVAHTVVLALQRLHVHDNGVIQRPGGGVLH